jgi:glycosyltransferase involved in cell wall biosynthesis
MPIGPDSGEREVLASATAVVTTSVWSRERLRDWYGLRHVAVALPGVDRPTGSAEGQVGAVPSRRSAAGGTGFLCVAAVHPGKGHDLLFEALAALGDRAWTLTCAGSLDVDPDHVAALQTQVYARSWERRVVFTGPLTGGALRAEYDAADLLVLPSRSESYGMVVVEALAHGLPVIATAVGGVPEALGQAAIGALPGLLVPPEDPVALAAALRAWLDDPGLRERLTHAVARRRPALRGWDQTAADVDSVLERITARGVVVPMAERARGGGRR